MSSNKNKKNNNDNSDNAVNDSGVDTEVGVVDETAPDTDADVDDGLLASELGIAGEVGDAGDETDAAPTTTQNATGTAPATSAPPAHPIPEPFELREARGSLRASAMQLVSIRSKITGLAEQAAECDLQLSAWGDRRPMIQAEITTLRDRIERDSLQLGNLNAELAQGQMKTGELGRQIDTCRRSAEVYAQHEEAAQKSLDDARLLLLSMGEKPDEVAALADSVIKGELLA